MVDEPLFSLEMTDALSSSSFIDDDNRFVDDDTGVDPTQIR